MDFGKSSLVSEGRGTHWPAIEVHMFTGVNFDGIVGDAEWGPPLDGSGRGLGPSPENKIFA